jgi:hypothetical protein
MNDDGNDKEGTDATRSGISDAVKRAVSTAIGAVLLTEEGIRHAVSDMKLPKEAVSYVVQQTEKSRREVIRLITDEVKTFLGRLDVAGEVRKALRGLKVEVTASVRFTDDGIKIEKTKPKEE